MQLEQLQNRSFGFTAIQRLKSKRKLLQSGVKAYPMPISRDLRNDRRRRMLRDSLPKEPARKRRSTPASDPNESASTAKRQPSYSQDVRKACGVRLVQLIPVRTSSYVAVVLASLLIPGTLLGLHYPIFVSGTWEWYGHPLVASLDVADNSRSILSWLNS